MTTKTMNDMKMEIRDILDEIADAAADRASASADEDRCLRYPRHVAETHRKEAEAKDKAIEKIIAIIKVATGDA
jgi:hypothetical protein